MNQIPKEYRPLSAWEYFFLTIIFNLPFIGFIVLIVLSIDSSNINRRSFARSYFCIFIIIAIILIVLLILGFSFKLPMVDPNIQTA